MTTLTLRHLNRALLARQYLLERQRLPALEVISRLGGMQTQMPFTPFTGLWSRIEGFRHEELDGLLLAREVVRMTLMRSTVHLVRAVDALAWWPLIQPVVDRAVSTTWLKQAPGIDRAALDVAAREILVEPRTTDQLGRLLQERFPGYEAAPLAHIARANVPLVQVTPRGTWGSSMAATQFPLESWTGQPVSSAPSHVELVRRYLAAFGPASVRDAQLWCGLTGLKATFELLRPELLTFRDEAGVELFDLPAAPRPEADTPAPVRLIAEFDNLLIGHADRRRVIADEYKRYVFTANGIIPGTILVDGFVAGTWRLAREKAEASLALTLFEPISASQCDDLEAEALAHLAFHAPGVAHRVTFIEAS